MANASQNFNLKNWLLNSLSRGANSSGFSSTVFTYVGPLGALFSSSEDLSGLSTDEDFDPELLCLKSGKDVNRGRDILLPLGELENKLSDIESLLNPLWILLLVFSKFDFFLGEIGSNETVASSSDIEVLRDDGPSSDSTEEEEFKTPFIVQFLFSSEVLSVDSTLWGIFEDSPSSSSSASSVLSQILERFSWNELLLLTPNSSRLDPTSVEL